MSSSLNLKKAGALFCLFAFFAYSLGAESLKNPDYQPSNQSATDITLAFSPEVEVSAALKTLKTNFTEDQGLRIEFGCDKDGVPTSLTLLKRPSFTPFSNSIGPNTPYSPDNAFKEFLEGRSSPLLQSPHSLAFPSLSRRTLLVIPRGPYVTFIEFLEKASEEEKKDFWQLVQKATGLLKEKGMKFGMASHIGSAAYQTVAHFHLRLETSVPLSDA